MLRRLGIVCVIVLAVACSPEARVFNPLLGQGSQNAAGQGGAAGHGQGGSASQGKGGAAAQGGSTGGAAGYDAAGDGPVTLASDQDHPMSIALDDTHVYWTNNDGTVMKVSKDGGSLTLVAVGPPEAWSIALGDTNVYWTSGANGPGGVMKVSKDGGSPVVLASEPTPTRNIAVDGAYVYWLTSGVGQLRKVPVDGGYPVTIASGFLELGSNPAGLAVHSSGIYWISDSGSVWKLPAGMSAPTPLTLIQANTGLVIQLIAVDSNNVYWTDFYNRAVSQVPINDGTVTTLASGCYVNCIAVDSTHVYWTQYSVPVGSVMKVPIGGGTAATVAPSEDGPLSIAVDSTHVYWTAIDSIRKVPK